MDSGVGGKEEVGRGKREERKAAVATGPNVHGNRMDHASHPKKWKGACVNGEERMADSGWLIAK